MPSRNTRAAAEAQQDASADPTRQHAPSAAPQATPTKLPAKPKPRAARHQPLVEPESQNTAEPADTTTTSTDQTLPESSEPQQQQQQPSSAALDEAAPDITTANDADNDNVASNDTPSDPFPSAASIPASKTTMSERMAKFSSLRKKMAESSKANRKDLLAEQSKSRAAAAAGKKGVGHARKLAEAEKLLEERDLTEAGEDVERHRNFGYSIEDNDRWESKLEEKERRRDKGVIDFQDAAERSYQRQVRSLKPDLANYEAQKAAIESSSSTGASTSSSTALTVRPDAVRAGQVVRREDLYRDASTIVYGDHKPSEEAIDRVVGHLNLEQEKIKRRSRRRTDDTDGEVDYINKKNQHFNKKLKRYYDEYTKEIRENCKWEPYPFPSTRLGLERSGRRELTDIITFDSDCWVRFALLVVGSRAWNCVSILVGVASAREKS
ncbi:Pre-mRNA-splicing factor SYF2 [Thecaphora frezii]